MAVTFQMNVRNVGYTYHTDRWGNKKYLNYFEATNPYTGRHYRAWDDSAPWRERDEDEEPEEDDNDCYAPMNKSEYDYWCNGIGYGR